MMLPPNAIDNHCHVLDPNRPSVPGARYRPFAASWREHSKHLAALGIHRGVLVTASTHGTDNQPMLDALGESDCELHGIAVVDPEVSEGTLETLRAAGVCGLRVQDLFPGGTPLTALVSLGERVAELGWHMEVWTNLTEHLDGLPAAIRRCRAPVVIDHLGYFSPTAPLGDRGLDVMIELAREEKAWITLSGAYRMNGAERPTRAGAALAARVHRLLDTIPDRLLWGSDWPHVAPPNGVPTRADLLAELDTWFAGDDALLARVTVTNNAACYGFA